MQNLKNTIKMLKDAERDFKALKNMTDESLFDVEILFFMHNRQ